ncbi:glycoside hydrolase family 5 protein [Telluria sp. Tellsp131]|uniref:glycoside hydrolase family 5 protein n=1 Tax=Massilia sp. CT11-108 TaxID=3393900 RepID=UPI0039A6AF8A
MLALGRKNIRGQRVICQHEYFEVNLKLSRVLILVGILSLNVGCGGGAASTKPAAPAPTTPAATTPAPTTPAQPTPVPTTPAPTTPAAGLFPDYNQNPIAPDAAGMGSTAVQLASKIRLGLNIGNTMEAIGGETAWGNPLITEALIKAAKADGFNAIRLPVAWDQYANQQTGKIDQAWMDRVKQVVKYCVDNQMYVLMNIHWDGGWLERNVQPDKQVAVNEKQKAFWTQIATQMRDFDEHLIFAGANEPAVDTANQMPVLMSYHQTFIDAVRATGGKNAYRVLAVQGPAVDIDKSATMWTAMPTDTVSNKLMYEVHFYPWQFTLMEKDEWWGHAFYYWGKDNHSTTDTAHNADQMEEAYVDQQFSKIRQQFVDKGIPVVLGEYAAMLRNNLTGDALALHKKSRVYYINYVTRSAVAHGLLPFYWDVGGLIDRGSNNAVLDPDLLDALVKGAIR